MKLKSGVDEIVYLLKEVFKKYEQEGGVVKANTNKRNYLGVARKLSEISVNLPTTAETLKHEAYPPDLSPKRGETGYPNRKYDISVSQLMDAYRGNVPHPKQFLIDSCYIYLFGVGRNGFKENPVDVNLIESALTNKAGEPKTPQILTHKFRGRRLLFVGLLIALLLLTAFGWYLANRNWETVKKDMSILVYQASPEEMDSVEGIWLCYTGSPQARESEPHRYHLVVSNIVEVKAKNGYFTFIRYGASFDHLGYMQFEAPWLLHIYSRVKNGADSIQSPRHSLLRLNEANVYHNAVSASWSFDVGNKNQMIGIREVYIKQGKGGHLEEIFNTIDNSSCKCKIIRWHRTDGSTKDYQLKNELLDTLANRNIMSLLNEKSIILCNPKPGLLISDSASKD